MPDNRPPRRRTGTELTNDCLIALSAVGCVVWRNNTGALRDARGRPVRFGLCTGSSDIIGVTPTGLFLAVECKAAGDRATDAQLRFIATVQAKGGRAGVARSVADAVAIAIT